MGVLWGWLAVIGILAKRNQRESCDWPPMSGAAALLRWNQ